MILQQSFEGKEHIESIDYHWLILALRAFQSVTGPPSPGGQAFVM